MSRADNWLITVKNNSAPHKSFRPSQKYRNLWLRGFEQKHEATAVREWLKRRGLKARLIKVKLRGSGRKRFANTQSDRPVFQVLDHHADPKAVMIAAYRKLKWQEYTKEFTAAAPQPEADPLPEPINPPPPTQHFTSPSNNLLKYGSQNAPQRR